MEDDSETKKILRSIKNALWIIVGILLMQLGFHLADFRSTPFAELIMLLGFWGGFFVILCLLVGSLVRLFVKSNDQ
jgi:uncharacterized Tic20 family protein